MDATFTFCSFNKLKLLLFTLSLLLIFNQVLLAQSAYQPAKETGPKKSKKKKKAKLPPEDLTGDILKNAKYNFKHSALKNVESFEKNKLSGADNPSMEAMGAIPNLALKSPTSLQFGPDGRLYVSQQNGIIYALTIVRNGANNYAVTATETINNINQIPNHNDNGVVNTSIKTRQVTGILVTGTTTQPILYVSSSDSRIGGPSGDLNLDTNSGIISRLTKKGSAWEKVDLVRGLPRSEENHANNGMQLDAATNTLYVTVGGSTNAGAPSINFAYTVEYALSAAIISINLNTINSMTVKGSGNTAYLYDLPTLDDPTRSNSSPGVDVNDPFGGNDGLNQAKIVTDGPVQIYSPGYRNVYDLVITKTPGKAGRMYTIDNGPNKGWGGYPQNEGPNGTATNNYVVGEPGSTGSGVNDPVVNNLDNLHFVGTVGSYVPGSYYGGHPTPIRANPNGAGLYTHNGSNGVFRTSKTGTNPLPADWPPVPKANPIEGDYQQPGVTNKAILTFNASTNGIAEYTGTRFDKILQGTLLAASYDGKLYKLTPTADGKDVTNRKGSSKINQDLPFASGFGTQPLDVTTQGDNDIFPGTVWVATYGSSSITVFEPEAATSCSGQYNTADDDGDKYTNADEIDNGTNPCSAASKPNDYDGDLVSDLNDADDDGDTIGDHTDYFPLDSQNGVTTQMPINYDLFNNFPGTGFFGLGFTGLMSNKKTDNDYINLFAEDSLIAGGAVGAFSVVATSNGDALGTLNNQENAFQFGVNTPSSTFTVHGRMLGPFFNNAAPTGFQSQGIFIGTGDQDNYLKITLNANDEAGGAAGIQVVYENAGTPVTYQFSVTGGIPNSTLDLYLEVNPSNGTVQPKYARDGEQIVAIGSPIAISGALITALQSTPALAIGIISTSRGAKPFTATWDVINVTTGTVVPGNPVTVSPTSIHFFSQQAGTTSASQAITLTNNESTATQITAVTLSGTNNTEFGHNFTSPVTINAGTSASINVTFKPTSAGGKSGQLNIKQLGISSILTVALDGEAVANPNSLPTANAGPDVTVALPASSVILNGSGTDSDGSVTGYTWNQNSGPNTAVFSNSTAQSPTVSGLIAGTYVFSLTVKDNLGANSAADLMSVTVSPASAGTLIYRINAGGGQVSNTIGMFSADNYFSPTPGYTHFTNNAIAGTTNEAMYQTERSSEVNNGTFTYNFPVNSGQYKVILHFAEIYWNSMNQRLFDVSLENTKVLDNYDIFQKAGNKLTAISETFLVNVTDGTLNIYFSALASDGGKDRPKIAAIEIIEQSSSNQAPTANAGSDKTITLPTNSVALAGSGTDPEGSALTYSWTQSSGPNITTISSTSAQNPTISGLIAGTYVFSLVVKDNQNTSSSPDLVTVTVNTQNTSNGSWQTLAASSGAVIGREENAFVQAGSKFYLIGGRGIKPVQEYNPATKTWTNKANVPVEMNHFQAVTFQGLIYVIGAMNQGYPHEVPLANVYIYNPGTDKWIVGSSIPQARRRGSAGVVVYNNKIYVISGITDGHWNGWVTWFDEFDPATNTWKTLANTPRARDHFHAAVLNNKLYVAGGRRSSASTNQTFSITVPEVDVYDFTSATWSTLPSGSNLPTKRAGAGTVVLGQELVVIGGESTQPTAHKETEALNVTTNTWRRLADLNQGRHGTQAIENNNGIYIVAGAGNQGGSPLLSSHEAFYPSGATTPTGTALTQSQLTVPTSAEFGQVTTGSSTSKTLTISNTSGNQAIVISTITKTGDAAFAFSTPYTLPFVIAPGASVNITITFNPTTSGTKTGIFAIQHSGTNSPTTLNLSGQANSTTGNQTPTANAGSDKTITLPINSVALAGSGTDPEGSALTYSWSQNSGPNTATISSTSAPNPTISGLIAGTYVFSLVVTDDQGASSTTDQVSIVVNPTSNNNQQVVSFTLMNADNEQEIRTIVSGETLNLANFTVKNLNIRANTTPTTVGSVKLSLTGAQTQAITETAAPYALFGDSNGNYNPWVPVVGSYTLTSTPYSAAGATGTVGTPLTITFSVSNQTAAARKATVFPETEVRNLNNAAVVTVFPNPFQEVVNLQITSPEPQRYNIKVYDVLGKRLYQSNFTIDSPGSRVYTLDFIKAKIPHHHLYYIIVEESKQSFNKVFKVSRSW